MEKKKKKEAFHKHIDTFRWELYTEDSFGFMSGNLHDRRLDKTKKLPH